MTEVSGNDPMIYEIADKKASDMNKHWKKLLIFAV